MKVAKFLILALALIFIAIQFLPDRLPENLPPDEKDIIHSGLITEEVLLVLKTSCFDCHSNQTEYPWYSMMAPSSWLLADHIKEGREHLNFSEWENYSRREKIGILDDINEEITSGAMPLKSYILIHTKAKLSPAEVALMTRWTEDATSTIWR
jgi:hypothetical protein